MLERLFLALENSNSLTGVKGTLLELLSRIKQENPNTQVWFISGVITAEGPELRSKNRESLTKYGEYIRDKYFPFAFSAVDVFSEELIQRVKATGAKSADFTPMWLMFIKESRDLLTGVITTPRWQNSPGSIMEVETAANLGLKVLNLEKELTESISSL